MLLYDAIQSYEDTLTITIYTGCSMKCPSFWGENVIKPLLVDDQHYGSTCYFGKDTYRYYTWVDGQFTIYGYTVSEILEVRI
jgi:hypothetical protein